MDSPILFPENACSQVSAAWLLRNQTRYAIHSILLAARTFAKMKYPSKNCKLSHPAFFNGIFINVLALYKKLKSNSHFKCTSLSILIYSNTPLGIHFTRSMEKKLNEMSKIRTVYSQCFPDFDSDLF